MTTDTTQETTGQRRLREVREAAAALEASAPSNADEIVPLRLPLPGERVHCLVAGTTIATGGPYGGTVLGRAQTFTITADMIAANVDRHGRHCGPSLVHHPEAQMEKYGEVRFAPGPAPAELEMWQHGDVAWAEARERARREAHRQPSAQARRTALAEVHRRFGAAPVSSVVLNAAPDPSVAAAEAQRAAIAAGGVRIASHYAPSERGGYSEDRG